jgi:hypothetical protein
MTKYVPSSFSNTTGAWWNNPRQFMALDEMIAMDEQDRKDNGQFGSGGGESGGHSKSYNPSPEFKESEKKKYTPGEHNKVGETEHHHIHETPNGHLLTHKHTGETVYHGNKAGKYEKMGGSRFPLSFGNKEEAKAHSEHFKDSDPKSKEIVDFHKNRNAELRAAKKAAKK